MYRLFSLLSFAIVCCLLPINAFGIDGSCPGGATTCSGGASTCFFRTGTNNRCVRMVHNDLIVDFDTHQGGAPLDWYVGSIANSFMSPPPAAGTGFQLTIDTGQDGTQAGYNGIDKFYVANSTMSNADQDYHEYYIREDLTPNWPTGATNYKVKGFLPDFWVSHEWQDDSLPPLAASVPQTRWATKYNPLGVAASTFTGLGTPIFFKSTSIANGVIFVGDQLDQTSPWNQRLREVYQGVFAMQTHVWMYESGTSAEGGIIFRAEVNTAANNLTIASLGSTELYTLKAKRNGTVELAYQNSSGVTTLLWSEYQSSYATKLTGQNSPGLKLEVRTDLANPNSISIYIDEQLRAVCPQDCGGATYSNTINGDLGEHFGLFAYDPTANKSIRFSERKLFDMGLEATVDVSPDVDGSVNVTVSAENIAGIVDDRHFARFNLVAFLNSVNAPDLPWFWTEDSIGELTRVPRCNTQIQPWIGAAQYAEDALWVGRPDGSLGLRVSDMDVEVCNGPVGSRSCATGTGGTSLLRGVAGSPILHLGANYPGTTLNASAVSITAKYERSGYSHTPVISPNTLDYLGICGTSLAVFRPTGAGFYINNSDGLNTSRSLYYTNGNSGSIPIQGDFDGDGKTDLGTVTNVSGFWSWSIPLSTGGTLTKYPWGLATDKIGVADMNNSGRDDLIAFRGTSTSGDWYVSLDILNQPPANRSDQLPLANFGFAGDKLVPADYDGDGAIDIAVWRPANGYWYIQESSNGNLRVEQWGLNGDIPVPADYFNDPAGYGSPLPVEAKFQNNVIDFGVYRPSNGTWYLKSSESSGMQESVSWGISGDVPVPGNFFRFSLNYNPDGVTDLLVFRPSNGNWYINNRQGGTVSGLGWGLAGDKVPLRFP